MTRLELPTIEHTFYDCLICIEQCYADKNNATIPMKNDWIHNTGQLVTIFEHFSSEDKPKYLEEARTRLSKFYGTADVITKLEMIAGVGSQ